VGLHVGNSPLPSKELRQLEQDVGTRWGGGGAYSDVASWEFCVHFQQAAGSATAGQRCAAVEDMRENVEMNVLQSQSTIYS